MTKKNNDLDIFEDDSTIPESAWFKFENVGDKVAGELLDTYEKDGKFGAQKIYVLRKNDGEEVIVPLKTTTHKTVIQKLRSAEVGDTIGFLFKELVDTGKSNPAKSIEVRIRHASDSIKL